MGGTARGNRMIIKQDDNAIIYQVHAYNVLTELADYTGRRMVDTDELRNLIVEARRKLDELEKASNKAMYGD